VELKTRILEAAAAILSTSSEADFSTRAVCEAAGVGAPALYRQFGDKEGLLAAVVDFGFEQYLSAKRSATFSDDAVQDLRNGWDNHVAFALNNPNYYRLMYSPSLVTRPEAAAEAHELLLAVVERAATAGRMLVPSDLGAQMIMSANVGVALSLLYRPDLSSDPALSPRVRDSIIDSITTPVALQSTALRSLANTAATLSSQLRASGDDDGLSDGERNLLHEWLYRMSTPHTVPRG
jgi:AcrR family transcriptional regulator